MKKVFYHPTQCTHCEHFCGNTLTAREYGAKFEVYCFGSGRKLEVDVSKGEFENCSWFNDAKQRVTR